MVQAISQYGGPIVHVNAVVTRGLSLPQVLLLTGNKAAKGERAITVQRSPFRIEDHPLTGFAKPPIQLDILAARQ